MNWGRDSDALGAGAIAHILETRRRRRGHEAAPALIQNLSRADTCTWRGGLALTGRLNNGREFACWRTLIASAITGSTED
jgi:hypothetical protein